jgi:cytochrome P450
VNIYAIHHSPEYWENPEEFNPDRFDKPTIPFAFMPFSLKQRACLGNQFSLVEQTVFMTTFLQHFSIKSLDFVAPQTANNPILNQIPGLKVNIKSV